MQRVLKATIALTLAATAARAQERPRAEIGTMLGVTMLAANGETEFIIGAPGAGTLLGLLPVFYLNMPVGGGLTLEPQVYFAHSTASSETIFSGVLQLGFVAAPTARSSPFFAAHGGILTVTDQDAEKMVGGSIGYRFLAGQSLALRVEARYRRWLDSEINDIAVLFGIGVRLH